MYLERAHPAFLITLVVLVLIFVDMGLRKGIFYGMLFNRVDVHPKYKLH